MKLAPTLAKPAVWVTALAVASLASIGYGCWLWHPPMGYIAVGGLVWIELYRLGMKR